VNVVLDDRLDIYTGTVENMNARIVDVTNKIYSELGADHPSKPTALLA
jgi:hypothetical protein